MAEWERRDVSYRQSRPVRGCIGSPWRAKVAAGHTTRHLRRLNNRSVYGHVVETIFIAVTFIV